MQQRSRSDSPTKFCTLDGCDNPLRARGLCAMHYKLSRYTTEQRHPSRTKICVTCGTSFVTRQDRTRFCSLLCRDYTRWGPLFSAFPRPTRAPAAPKPQPFREDRECAWCGAEFVAHRNDHINCSTRCKRKAIHMRRRGKESQAGGTYTWAEVMHVFLILGRCCAYCEQPIVGQPDPDHVVPLSKGGSNSITNILPSCRACNSDKRDLLLSEWSADRLRRHLPTRTTSWTALDPRIRHLTCISQAA